MTLTPNQKSAGIIVVIAVVVLLGLWFLGTRGVGKAAFIEEGTVGTAGFRGVPADIAGKTAFNFDVAANIGAKKSLDYVILLKYPSGKLDIGDATTSGLGAITFPWGDATITVGSDVALDMITLRVASLDFTAPITGADQLLARIPFKLKPGVPPLTEDDIKAGVFDFVGISVYDSEILVDSNLITVIKQPSAEIVASTCPAPDLVACTPICTAGGLNDCTTYTNCQATCNTNKATVCAGLIEPGACPPATGYNADLTLDSKFDGQDAQVIFGTRDAKADATCGALGEAPCVYDRLHICDGGSFRVRGLTIYNGGLAFNPVPGAVATCPFTMVR